MTFICDFIACWCCAVIGWLSGVLNPQSWLTYALTNIQDTKLSNLDKLMPWNYIEGS